MKRLLVVMLAVMAFGACKKADGAADDDGTKPGGDDDTSSTPDATIPTNVTDVSTDITSDTTWNGLIKIHKSITVAAGVTLNVDAGSVLELDTNVSITVNGTANVNGAKNNVVTVGPGAANRYWGNWNLSSGTLNMTYVESRGGGFSIQGAGKLMARDSEFSQHTHDLLVVGTGGTVDMQYSWIGVPEGDTDSTHCDMHVEGSNVTMTVSHSNISTSAYGIMFYGGSNLNFTYNNWFGNSTDIDKFSNSSGDVSFGYFKKGNPSFSGLTAGSMATSMVADAGPR